MQELALISKTIPAVVSFNYAEIDAHLDEVLKKYGGLLFTDETVAECKKTIAELKKGKKSLNDFKIKTKKLLTEDITKFEDQCKKLSDKFDTVINPIGVQADAFEIKRIEDKRLAIQTIIDTLTDERFLEYKYYSQLVITEQMLNKGTKIKAITIDLTKQADLLLSQQSIEEANIELIKSKVELANAQYGVTLLNNLYLSLLSDGKDVNSLVKMINENAEQTKIRAEEAETEKLAIEVRRIERADRLAAEKVAQDARIKEADRINKERQIELAERIALLAGGRQAEEFEESKRQMQADKKAEESKVAWSAEINKYRLEAMEKECLGKVVTPNPCSIETQEDAEVLATETYTVTGTESQLDALEAYLNTNGYVWI